MFWIYNRKLICVRGRTQIMLWFICWFFQEFLLDWIHSTKWRLYSTRCPERKKPHVGCRRDLMSIPDGMPSSKMMARIAKNLIRLLQRHLNSRTNGKEDSIYRIVGEQVKEIKWDQCKSWSCSGFSPSAKQKRTRRKA